MTVRRRVTWNKRTGGHLDVWVLFGELPDCLFREGLLRTVDNPCVVKVLR